MKVRLDKWYKREYANEQTYVMISPSYYDEQCVGYGYSGPSTHSPLTVNMKDPIMLSFNREVLPKRNIHVIKVGLPNEFDNLIIISKHHIIEYDDIKEKIKVRASSIANSYLYFTHDAFKYIIEQIKGE